MRKRCQGRRQRWWEVRQRCDWAIALSSIRSAAVTYGQLLGGLCWGGEGVCQQLTAYGRGTGDPGGSEDERPKGQQQDCQDCQEAKEDTKLLSCHFSIGKLWKASVAFLLASTAADVASAHGAWRGDLQVHTVVSPAEHTVNLILAEAACPRPHCSF